MLTSLDQVQDPSLDIYIDKTLRHTIRNLGSTASPLSSSIDNPIYLRNENTTNATDFTIPHCASQ